MNGEYDKENAGMFDDRRSGRDERKIPAGVLKKRAQLPSADRNKIDRDSGRVAELLRALDDQEAEHQLEIDELEKKRTEDLTALWDEHWRRVNEIEELRAEQEKYTDHLRETLREMEIENSELREQRKGSEPLLRQLADMEDKVARLADGVAEREAEVDSLKSDLETKIDRIRDLEERNRHQQSENAALEKKLSSVPRHDSRVPALEDQVRDLERQTAERDVLVKTQKQLIESKDEMLKELKSRIAELEDAVDRAQNVEQLQQQLLREKQEKNDNLIHLVEEQREQIGKLSMRDDRSEDTSRNWERSSVVSQGYPNGAKRSPGLSPYDRPPRGPSRSAYSPVPEEAPRYPGYAHHEERSGYESDERKPSSSIVESRPKTPSRQWADLADQHHKPASPPYIGQGQRVRETKPTLNDKQAERRKLSTNSTSSLARKAPLHPPTKRYDPSAVRSSGSVLRSTTTSALQRPPAASRSSTVSESPSKQSWRGKAEHTGSSRLEQLKSELKDARSERLRIQSRKKV